MQPNIQTKHSSGTIFEILDYIQDDTYSPAVPGYLFLFRFYNIHIPALWSEWYQITKSHVAVTMETLSFQIMKLLCNIFDGITPLWYQKV